MLVSPSGVGVAVYPRVTGQLVGSRELLGATRELADVRLLAGVGADVPRLVLQTVECLVAEGAFVRARQLGCRLHGLSTGEGPIRTYHGDRRHVFVSSLWILFLSLSRGSLGVQQVGKIPCRLCSLHVIALDP